jgi:hypothetical protein
MAINTTLFDYTSKGSKDQPTTTKRSTPTAGGTALFDYTTPARAKAPQPAAQSGLNLSEIDKEIAAKRAEIVQRQKDVAAAKAKQAADEKYAKEHPILSALEGAFGATNEQGFASSPQGIQLGMGALKHDLKLLEQRKADSLKQGKAIAAPTTGQKIIDVPKGLVRGPIRAVADIASWAGIAGAPGEYVAKGVESLGESAIKGLGLEQAPELQYSGLSQRIGQGTELIGGMAAFAPLQMVNAASKVAGASKVLQVAGKGAKAAEFGMAGGMGARQARETMDAYEERTGEKLDPVTRSAVQVGGTIIGAAIMLPVKAILSKAAPEVSTAANQQITGILARLGQSRIGKSEAVTAVKSILADVNATAAGRVATKGAAPTGAVLGSMQAGQNLLEMGYNPEKRSLTGLGEGVGEATLSGLVGGAAARGAVEGFQAHKTAKINAQRQKILDDLAEQEATNQEQDGQDYGTFDVVSRDANNKVQREQVKVVSEPDAEGMVTVQRADGTRSDWSLDELKAKHAPAESTRAIPVPETMSRQAIAERLRNSLGNFEPDEHLNDFIKNTADKVADGVVLGRPEAPETYLKDQEGRVNRKRKISEESRIGHSLVLDEARKVLNEYTDLVTTPPEGAAPKAPPVVEPNAGETVTTPPAGNEAPPTPPAVEEVVQNRAQSMREENARRTEMLDRVANDPNIVDKPGAFEEMLDQSGFDAPTPHEIAHLHDAMRLASEHETALNLTNARVEDIRNQEARKAGASRVDVIENHLYDPEMGPRKKISKINDELEAAGLEKLSEDEVNRYQAVADAIATYGPKGERQRKLDEIMADEAVTNKLEAFRKKVGEPTEEEAAALGVDFSIVEGPSTREKPKRNGAAREAINEQIRAEEAKLNAEPHKGTPAAREAINAIAGLKAQRDALRVEAAAPVEEAAAPKRNMDIAARAEEANQRLADAAERAKQSRAEVDRINAEIEAEQAKLDAQPHVGTPAARKAINALKDLEAERVAAEEAAAAAEAARKVDPAEVLKDAEDEAISEAFTNGHGPNSFLAGVDDIRNGRKPLDIHDFAKKFGFVEPGEQLRFMINDERPVRKAYEDYASGADWARERVARAEEAGGEAPKAEVKPASTSKFETTIETNGEKRTVAGEGALTEEQANYLAGKGPEPTPERAAPKVEAEPAPERAAPKVEAKAEPEDIVMSEPERGGLNAAADEAQRVSLARNWRMAPWYKNLVFQFGGGTAAENAVLKSLGVDKLPAKLSVKDRLEMLVTNRNGMIREINRQFINPISKEIARLYKEEGIHADEISDALQARAAAQRNAKVGLEDGAGMTNAEAEAYLTDLKLSNKLQKMDKIIQLHDALRTRMQDIAVENGLISREKMDQFIAEEPDYTPFKGWAENGDMLADSTTHQDYGKPEFVRKGLGVNRNIVRKAEGRSTLAANSLVHLMADAQTMALKAAENKPARTLLDLMDAHPEQMADIVSIVPKPGADTLTVMRDGKAYNLKFEDTPAGNAMKSAFTEIADPMKRAEWVKKFDRVSSLLRGVNTTMSPLFWPKALWKDSMDAVEFVLSEKGMKDSPLYGKEGVTRATIKYSTPFGETWHGVFDYLTDATPKTEEGARVKQMIAEMVENGGTAGYAFREHAQDIREQMQKAYDRLDAMGKNKALLETNAGRKQLMDAIHSINDFIDMVPRAAVYRAATEAGVPPPQAAKIALEASLNLPRRGRFGSTIDMVKWYTNAGIQSTAKKGRMLRSANGRKILAAHMAMGSAVALWNISVAGDKNHDGKNDYLQLPAWRKAMGLTLYSPSGETAITIPIGFMGSFETYFGQKMAEVAYGITSPNDGAAALSSAPADIAKGFISSQLPLGRSFTTLESPLDAVTLAVPDPLMPIENIRTNRDAFGEAIYNEPFNKEQAKSSVPRASTNQVYKDWASWLNDHSGGHGKFAGLLDSHPETWQYLIKQYTGGIGKFVGDVAQLKNPFKSTYIVDESHAGATDYYEVSPRMRQVKEAFGPTGKKDQGTIAWLKENRPVESNPRVRGAYSTAEKRLDGIKARETNLQKNKLPPEQKQIIADKIEADKQAIFAQFLRVYNEVENKQ